MFGVMFALARSAGWIAQWREMVLDPEQSPVRPRQVYVGAAGTRVRAARVRASPERSRAERAGARERRAAPAGNRLIFTVSVCATAVSARLLDGGGADDLSPWTSSQSFSEF